MPQAPGALGGVEKLELVFPFLQRRQVVVERVEIPVPLPPDLLDEADVGRLDEGVERPHAPTVNRERLHSLPVPTIVAFSGDAPTERSEGERRPLQRLVGQRLARPR